MKFKGTFKKKFPKKVEKTNSEPEYSIPKKEITQLPDGMKSILSVNGYSLPKTNLSGAILSMIRRDLVITPHVERPEYGTNIVPIKIFEETEKRIYMPRFYGISTFGMPVDDKLTHNSKIVRGTQGIKVFNPSIKLRENQIPIVDKVVHQLKTNYGGVLSCYCGFGKCHGINTPILMFDGTIKMVQDVIVGDQLMGDNGTFRTVLSLARGREQMYKIVPKNGDPYVVNESHILSLSIKKYKTVGKTEKYHFVKYFDPNELTFAVKEFSYEKSVAGSSEEAANNLNRFVETLNEGEADTIDIPLRTYMGLSNDIKRQLRGYRVPVDFEHKDVPVNPYFLGVMLADKPDHYAPDRLERIEKIKSKFVPPDFKLDVRNIPHLYKCNSRLIRTKLLAGIIDSMAAHFIITERGVGEYEINLDEEKKDLAHDIVFLSRSLGLAASIEPIECKNTIIYRVLIFGDGIENIPVLLKKHKASALQSQHQSQQPKNSKKDYLTTKISVERMDVDDYYGFELDGNHRYLLGDFQVTHNTLSALKICSLLNVKTAVICHTSDLMFQWKQEIEKLLPFARIGLVQQDKCITEDKDIIIVSLKTLALKDFPVGLFDDIGLSIWDEIHLMVTQLFSKAFMKMITPYSLGLSATPFRKDKCEKIFYNFIGPITHYEKRGPNNTVLVDCIVYKAENLVIAKDFKDDIIYTTTVTGMCYSEERINFIAKIISKIVSQVGRKILVLSEYVQHLKDIKDAVEKISAERLKTNALSRPITCGLYIGEMNNDQRTVSRECDVILGTYKIASVGMDIPDLNCLVLASPRKDIEQSVGRIFRKVGALKPRIIDVIDDHPMFISQGRVRKEFYKQYEFTIVQSKVDWTGKVSSQRILFDATNVKKTRTAKTIESLMSEESGKGNGSKDSDEKDDGVDLNDSQQNIEEMFHGINQINRNNNDIQILSEEEDDEEKMKII